MTNSRRRVLSHWSLSIIDHQDYPCLPFALPSTELPAAWAGGWSPWRRPIHNWPLRRPSSRPATPTRPGRRHPGGHSPAGRRPVGRTGRENGGAPVDVVIDFSVPTAAEAIIDACFAQRLPLILATTGLTAPQIDKLRVAAGQIPLLWSPNTSLAVNLTMKLCEVAAQALADKDADVEIIERHHRFKEDAPSGTALKFGEVIARNMGQTAQRTAAVAGQGNAPTGRSAITPSAWATTRASTQSFSACWARRSNLRSAPAIAIAMPKGHWRPPSFSPASRLDSTP